MAGSVPPAVVKTSTRARRSYCFSLLQREHQGVRRVSEFYSSEVHPTFCFRCFHPPPPHSPLQILQRALPLLPVAPQLEGSAPLQAGRQRHA